ncbi:MAG: N-acetylglucosamine-6-phosphate deacetylase [Ruminococcaceae bacterium]|nr:N-acetylglucosamine-6-phosphate deacetylase [Oscillospiraceae bacterium]
MTYIVNGKIVLPDSVVCDKILAFDGESGKICGLVDKLPANAETIDAAGNYVAPGLVDIHIHGYLGEDTCDAKPEGIKKMAYGVVQNGVTAFLPTTMTVSKDQIVDALNAVRSVKEESKTWGGAEIIGVHAEGPFINPSKKGAQAEENILKPDADFIIENADIITSVTLAPEMDEGHQCIKKLAKESNVLVSMGHTDAKFEEAMSAAKDGVNHATHLFNAMSALAHRNPGVVGAALSADNVSVEVIADTFHINPGLYSIVAKVKGDKMILITDCTRAGGMPDGEYDLGGQPIFLKGIECRLADGTIAGSVLKLNNAVKNVIDHTDLPVHEIFNMASLNAATAIGCADRIGSLEAGKDADIIITDETINIIRTIKKGKTVYEA